MRYNEMQKSIIKNSKVAANNRPFLVQMFKMEKNYYQKPLMIVEKFTVQDYISSCIVDSNKYSAGEHYYLDFNGDRACQSSSEAVDESGKTTYPDGRYSSVGIYQHQYQALLGWTAVIGISSPDGKTYGNDWWVFAVHYRLNKMGEQSLIINNGQVYNNQS